MPVACAGGHRGPRAALCAGIPAGAGAAAGRHHRCSAGRGVHCNPGAYAVLQFRTEPHLQQQAPQMVL